MVRDTDLSPGSVSGMFRSLNVRSFLGVPVVQNGRWRFLLAVHHPVPHEWRDDEIDLVRELGTRVWSGLERAKAEEALAAFLTASDRQRRLYDTVLSNTPDFVYVFDLNHRFTYINEALLRTYGLTWEEASGKDWIGLGYEQWHAEMHDREIDQVIATKRPIRGEVPFTGTNGRRIYDYIFVPVLGSDGEVEAVAGTTRDVTERKQAEAADASDKQSLRADRHWSPAEGDS
jgi:PAS domain S-box-containing protein